jgi:hypothetical protein
MNLNGGIVGHYHASFIRTLGYSSVPATTAALNIESSFAQGTTRSIGTKIVEIDCDC